MRKLDIEFLNRPYEDSKGDTSDRRFYSAIKADLPNAAQLANEVYSDFDLDSFGIRWWTSLPQQERILIGDYLYQCAHGIEGNLGEAKLHILEWLDARDRENERIANVVSRDMSGRGQMKMPPSVRPLDDLPKKMESLHLCGFFRAIGSCLDCLGASVIGVLALPVSLRRSSIEKAEKALSKIESSADPGIKIQTDFRTFLTDVKDHVGTTDWLEWADQYRNMYVHRPRRTSIHQIHRRDVIILDQNGQPIPRATSTTHLSKYPDRSDIEAFILGPHANLGEDAEVTINGIFKSVREMSDSVCERLLGIWKERRNNPVLLEQPQKQWNAEIRSCDFEGYDLHAKPMRMSAGNMNPLLVHRLLAAAVDDGHRILWKDSKWTFDTI